MAFMTSVTECMQILYLSKLHFSEHQRWICLATVSRSSWLQARGEVHHDRRLHQLMLLEACKEWSRQTNDALRRKDEVNGVERRMSTESCLRTTSSPTDSVSSLHEGLTDCSIQEFRSVLFFICCHLDALTHMLLAQGSPALHSCCV